MSEVGGGRCGRCGAYIHGESVEVNGWWLHKECDPAQEPDEPHSCESCPTCGVHGGRHDKCCGCYDGVCCQESEGSDS